MVPDTLIPAAAKATLVITTLEKIDVIARHVHILENNNFQTACCKAGILESH